MPTPEWHWEHGNRYAIEGLKVLLLLNGGAAIALLTFLGHSPDEKKALVGIALTAFAVGAALATMIFLTAYLAHFFYGNNNRDLAVKCHFASYAIFLLSMASFILGVASAYYSIAANG